MRLDINLAVAFVAAAVGVLAFFSNPKRLLNRIFLTLSFHAALWLIARELMFRSTEGLFWLRISAAIGAFFPLHFWVVKEVVAERLVVRCRGRLTFLPWLISGILLAGIPLTDWFIPSDSTAEDRRWGAGYLAYAVALIFCYAELIRQTISQIRRESGVKKIELQLLLYGGCGVAGGILVLMAIRLVWDDLWWLRVNPQAVAVLVFYTATVVVMTTSRVFDARQIVRVAGSWIALIAAIAAFSHFIFRALSSVASEFVSLFASTALSIVFFSWFRVLLIRLLEFYPEAEAARQAAFAAAQRESRVDRLEQSFVSIIRGWGQSEIAILLQGAKGMLSGSGIDLARQGAELSALSLLRWATPERLAREKPTPERQELARFLEQHGLGVLVLAEGPSLTAVIGVGVGASRRPYTYPQVTQLLELASIMESALERAHFSAKVQHAEQLATVGLLGASMAHEIRNPLVSIKTFVQLLPTHYQDPAFREKFFRLIGSEVSRIDQLTEQLLDLSTPRTYAATRQSLHAVLQSSLDLVTAKAADQGVEVRTEFLADPDAVYTDAAAARQVMLNLCFNAIQAVEAHASGERWIRIATRNTAAGVEMVVTDNGPGIAPEMQQRLFQPFQTTKSSGFGLGLAICRDILANLGATITVDPSVPAAGATFRVVFPCQASSS
jgi:signal transduction histidine kinase